MDFACCAWRWRERESPLNCTTRDPHATGLKSLGGAANLVTVLEDLNVTYEYANGVF
jgi:hypothetical protein